MSQLERRQLESNGWFTRPCWNACSACLSATEFGGGVADGIERSFSQEEEETKQQYTLESRVVDDSILPFKGLRKKLCCCLSRSAMKDDSDPDGRATNFLFIDINKTISAYLSWTFRTSYFLMFVAFAIFYYILILIWALIYFGIANKWNECITSAGNKVGTGKDASVWADCFQLSWTTLSTVGYGIVYPATGASDFFVPQLCLSVGVMGSLEAFVGVLYAGFCGAILFGKVARAQSRAQVLFSDPIVVRFGKDELLGNNNSEHNDERKDSDVVDLEVGGEDLSTIDENKSKTENDKNIPCPSLEFRLMNRLHDVKAGEIVEAQLNCVGILDPKYCQGDVMDTIATKYDEVQSSDSSDDLKVNEKTTVAELAAVLHSQAQSGKGPSHRRTETKGFAFHSSESKQPRVFCKLELDAEEHPYFRRVWFGRHRLDENSPLLTQAAKERIKMNGGYWPADMNNYQTIKKSLHFRHILVNMNGTSNANAMTVYAQKVYDLVDVNIGYRFVPMNYHDDNGVLKTDSYLLNAVCQQRGGGAEPFY
mmetsp:Transcript_14695/g.30798  ORF Transcript_14695/g.30798 Transcript_14695/m.30798 type:complete len:538 (+) Transcript_14695:488-2101(+)